MSWNAADYSRNSTAQTAWARELVAALHLEGWERVLDLGCGDGRVTSEIHALVPGGRAVGIDLSPDMIALARATYGGRAGLEFHVMDVRRVELGDVFDVAFSNAALHWVPDHPTVLRTLRAHLSDRGRILFQMGGRGNASAMQHVVESVCASPPFRERFVGFPSPYHFYGPEVYESWLRGCGYRPVRVRLLPKDMRHDGVEGLRGWLRTTWFPYSNRLPEADREGFWDAVLERYLIEHPMDAEGRTHVAMVRLEVEAVVV